MYPCNRIVYPSMLPQLLWLHIPYGEIFHWNFAHTRKNMFLFSRTLIFIGTFCENKMRSLRLCKCYFKFQHMDGPWGMRLVYPWSHAIPSSHQNVFPPTLLLFAFDSDIGSILELPQGRRKVPEPVHKIV